jgi:hypothetical protein
MFCVFIRVLAGLYVYIHILVFLLIGQPSVDRSRIQCDLLGPFCLSPFVWLTRTATILALYPDDPDDLHGLEAIESTRSLYSLPSSSL